MNKTVYRLFKANGAEQIIYEEEFSTYEEAYDKMVELYCREPDPVRWGIQKVSYSNWGGSQNVSIMPCWG